MWAIRVYSFVWLAAATAAIVTYITGYFNYTAQTIFGFLLASLFAAGVVMVLPAWVSEHFAPENRTR